jgi:class 3 adenylate cyclase/tetratricopeptide (TPR) repeat protein
MKTCGDCGEQNPERARFCLRCGSELVPVAAGAREERKVVTVLFADLVGFTGRAERLDPEEVRAVLQPYHARLRAELERFGGTVEKFIGDAVMAVFGAPAAHEDDPERAVRAALAIREALEAEGELHVRIGITTGEALVSLGARPEEGEGMAAGDVVNTAARLQAGAPVDGILVDETTYRATERAIAYRESGPVVAKGKEAPVAVWEAGEARARFGVDWAQGGGAPLVGRERELDVLLGTLARARSEPSLQLVTLVGVPGIGKSRLVWELSQVVEEDPELIFWRQGRSLPYGDGITFWALGEMVKAHAGVLETDEADVAAEKLREAVRAAVAEGDAARWVEGHLRPLVGLQTQDGRGDTLSESFAAWRRFFEGLAEQSPLVLVFEDLHWADDSLLDFVDHLVDWASGVPVLVVCTARPELVTRRPDWGGGKTNATALSLSPLSDEDTARLVAALLERSVLPAEIQAAVLARAGGNPLYAEEYSRMLAERGADVDLELPETVQGIIAARLDGLTPEEKELLQDAAVLGKVFWLGAVAGISGRKRASAEELLHGLERREFVRRERRSSVAHETEYAFRHLLVRDVAYGQIPRAVRATKHESAASWLESLSTERAEEKAEMLAAHYLAALDYARAAGQPVTDLAERARLVFWEAGERALALSALETAIRFFEQARELWPAEDADLGALLLGYGKALVWARDQGEDVLSEAIDLLQRHGREDLGAEAETMLGELIWRSGQSALAQTRFERAEALIEPFPRSAAKAHVLAQLSRFHMLAARNSDAIRLAADALAMAEELGLDELRVHALNNLGSARVAVGDTQGFTDLERSIEIGLAANSAETHRAYINLAAMRGGRGEIEEMVRLHREGLRLAERFGHRAGIRWLEVELALDEYLLGRWDEALERAERFLAELGGHVHYMETGCLTVRSAIGMARGATDAALADAARIVELDRVIQDPQNLFPGLSFRALSLVRAGRPDEALPVVRELLELARQSESRAAYWFVDAAVALTEIGRTEELVELAGEAPGETPYARGLAALARGDLLTAAEAFEGTGSKVESSYVRLLAGERLVAAGRQAEADAQLAQALTFYRGVRASAYVRRAEALLAASA